MSVVERLSSDETYEALVWQLSDLPPGLMPEGDVDPSMPLRPIFDKAITGHDNGSRAERAAKIGLALNVFHAQGERADPKGTDLLRVYGPAIQRIVAPNVKRYLSSIETGDGETIARLRWALDLVEDLGVDTSLMRTDRTAAGKELRLDAARALWQRALRIYPRCSTENDIRCLPPTPRGGLACVLGEIGLLDRSSPEAPEDVQRFRASRLGRAVGLAQDFWRLDSSILWSILPPEAQNIFQDAASLNPDLKDIMPAAPRERWFGL